MPHLTPTLQGSSERKFADAYFTPASATRALLTELPHWPKIIWEPACGNGAIVRVLRESGREVIASDRWEHEGEERFSTGEEFDFLSAPVARASSVITNPPFKLANAFARKCLALGIPRFALLLRADFFNAAEHARIFAIRAPSAIAALTWRLDFTGAGAPHTNCIWAIWDERKNFDEENFKMRPWWAQADAWERTVYVLFEKPKLVLREPS